MDVVLYEPEIPPNTGNVARLCAASCTPLHLIEPLGFSLEDRHLRRAGLDYWPHVALRVYPDWQQFVRVHRGRRLVLSSARRGVVFDRFDYQADDMLVFGPETRGLPETIYRADRTCAVSIPIWGAVRSLNMATAAGILLYTALSRCACLGADHCS